MMPKLFRNAQWVVTRDGLEALPPERYPIPKADLKRDDWTAFMAGKHWVDQDAFAEAHAAAIKHHFGGGRTVDVEASMGVGVKSDGG
jgi:hypothetical protein